MRRRKCRSSCAGILASELSPVFDPIDAGFQLKLSLDHLGVGGRRRETVNDSGLILNVDADALSESAGRRDAVQSTLKPG